MIKKLAIEGGKRSFLSGEIPVDQHQFREKDLERILEVLKSGRYSMFNNQTIRDFEDLIANYLGVKKCSVLTNCTSALDASFRALDIKEGDEIIMPAYTYAATMMAILSAGAKPIFVDIDYDTLTLNPKLIEEKLTHSTKAIVPVHIFGNPCEVGSIMQIAKRYSLRVIEDCAHSLSAKYNGKMTGSFDIGCHSFGENKILRIGEGGAVTSDDEEFINRVEIIRHEGEVWARKNISASYGIELKLSDLTQGIDYVMRGHNFRYSPILAALGISKFDTLNEQITAMNNNARVYNENLRESLELRIPTEFHKSERIYSSYIVLVESDHFDRNTLLLALAMEGVPVGIHFPKPLHKTRIYNTFSNDHNFPNSERFCNNHLALPVYPNVSAECVTKICDVVNYVINELEKKSDKTINRFKQLFDKTIVKHFYSGVYVTV